jgi:septal ring factor EnvC (AmiA/AmiB activator)
MKAIWGTLGVSASIALIAFAYFWFTLALETRTNSKHVANLLMDYSTTSEKLNKTLDTINGQKGTLVQLNDLIKGARATVDHSDRLMSNQQKSLDQWNSQITTTLGNVNDSVVALTTNENKITKQTVETLNAATESVKAVKPLVDNLTIEAQDLQTTTTSINAIIPDIQATAKNVSGMTADGKETTAMAKDWLHGILHPTWATRIKNAMLDVLQHLPVP